MKAIVIKLGVHMRQKRCKLGISQDKLALLADIDRTYVGRSERDEVYVTLEKADRLAEALRCFGRAFLP